jgi:DNA primase
VPPEPTLLVREPLTAPEGATRSEWVKASVTVLEFVSQYVGLKPTASGAIGLCPFHDDHHLSFGINVEGSYWHCFAGCGGGGGDWFLDEVAEV